MVFPQSPLFFSVPGTALGRALRAAQALADLAKELLVRIGAGEEQADAPVLRKITVPILSSLSRMVATWARANTVPARPSRRMASPRT